MNESQARKARKQLLRELPDLGYPGGRTRQFTVPAEHKGQVQRWLRNYRKLRAKLEAICELNHELLGADP